MVTNWKTVFNTDSSCVNALVNFADGNLSCEEVQLPFRNRYTEASGQVRKLIRLRGTNEARKLTRKALRRRNLAVD